jgi:hypothetical protein
MWNAENEFLCTSTCCVFPPYLRYSLVQWHDGWGNDFVVDISCEFSSSWCSCRICYAHCVSKDYTSLKFMFIEPRAFRIHLSSPGFMDIGCGIGIRYTLVLTHWSRDSAVGIASGYELDGRGVGVRVPVGSRMFSSSRRPDRFWGLGPHDLTWDWTRAAAVQSRQLTTWAMGRPEHTLSVRMGCAIAQAVSHRLPTVAARVQSQVMLDLWWTKWHWGRFYPSASVSPANSHSSDYSTLIIYHPGLVQ